MHLNNQMGIEANKNGRDFMVEIDFELNCANDEDCDIQRKSMNWMTGKPAFETHGNFTFFNRNRLISRMYR